MNKPEILRKIGNIIQELQEQHQYLSETPKINILELELFTANADFLIDHIEILKKLNNTNEQNQHVLQQHVPVQEKEVQETIKEEVFVQDLPEVIEVSEPEELTNDVVEISTEEPVVVEENQEKEANEFKFSFEEPVEMVFDFEKELPVNKVFDRDLTVEEQEVIAQKQQSVFHKVEQEIVPEPTQKVVEDIKLEIKEEKPVEPEIKENSFVAEDPFLKTVDAPKEEKVIQPLVISTPTEEKPEESHVMSLNELLSAKSENKANNTSTSFSNNKPTVDLKSAISLNDKMMFIRELFNGYNLAYSEAIEILNRFDSFESADNFLMKNYAEKNNWAAKQDVVDRLYNIINRKFKS
jgi:hypothetical protein